MSKKQKDSKKLYKKIYSHGKKVEKIQLEESKPTKTKSSKDESQKKS